MVRLPNVMRFLLVGLAIGIGACGPSVPTLPLPPPTALTSAPDGSGFVTVEGMGAAVGSLVSVYNENTESGVIEPAEDDETFSVLIEAQIGDSLLVWQSRGVERSSAISLIVPED